MKQEYLVNISKLKIGLFKYIYSSNHNLDTILNGSIVFYYQADINGRNYFCFNGL